MSDLRTWDAWHNIHQPFELEWWRNALASGHSDDESFLPHWQEIKDFIEPQGLIVDIGCGPRPPFAPCTVIDPLAEKYREIVPPKWWENVITFAQPAEKLVEALRSSADTVICWNCIDHAIGWRNILGNMRAYAKPGAKIAIATDFWEPFVGHPGFPRAEFMAEVNRLFDVVESREPFGRALALILKAKE